jgi:toxin ParE1/3/4
MAHFDLTHEALSDLKSIARYTQKTWGKRQRNDYLSLLDTSFHALATEPLMGRDCGKVRDGYRKYQVGKHVIFYRICDTNSIEVVRILHERMDIELHL